MGDREKQFGIREYVKRWPWLYYLIVDIFGPLYFGGLNPKVFLKQYARTGKRLNLGSGPRFIDSSLVHVDATPYEGVHCVADIAAVPFESGSISMIVCDNVLEHVSDPRAALREMNRLLEKEGVVYIAVPFLYPYHSSPHDNERWTRQGLEYMCRDFDVLAIGVRSGPFSLLTVYLVYFFATVFSFGSSKLYEFLSNILIFVFFPIKYLDIVGNHLPFAENLAADFFIVLRKR